MLTDIVVSLCADWMSIRTDAHYKRAEALNRELCTIAAKYKTDGEANRIHQERVGIVTRSIEGKDPDSYSEIEKLFAYLFLIDDGEVRRLGAEGWMSSGRESNGICCVFTYHDLHQALVNSGALPQEKYLDTIHARALLRATHPKGYREDLKIHSFDPSVTQNGQQLALVERITYLIYP